MRFHLAVVYGIVLVILLIAFRQFFVMLEKKKQDFRLLVVISVLTALSVTGRLVFAILPGFKPVTAVVIISGIYFGKEAGFLTGSLTALISNLYFGQGAWTPFQMIVWGIIGGIAGIGSGFLRNHRFGLYLYSAASGAIYSLLMDIYTVLWIDGYLNGSRYLTALLTSLPFTVIYAVSNVIFMMVLRKPIGRKLMRVRKKFGLESLENAAQSVRK
ncbi:MAG: ECF transporter S component [Lachnospiraceae bacterium]|nr:ECF transporter S component [Lachnospiraceae bacterium]